jgi:hypothetical protein
MEPVEASTKADRILRESQLNSHDDLISRPYYGDASFLH